MPAKILVARNEIEPFLDRIRKAADSERNSFGFLPISAYDEFAYQGRAIVAVDSQDNGFLGYLLYGGALPQGRVFQTYCSPKSRGQGIARAMLSEAIVRLERDGYLSVKADVASDLNVANRFYSSQGFEVIKTRAGGKTRNRTINICVRELATPSLLDLCIPGQVGHAVLKFQLPVTSTSPLYIVDLNVVFDVVKQRIRAETAAKVFAAGMENHVTLAITTELIEELERNTITGKPDPILEMVKVWPRLQSPNKVAAKPLLDDLAPLIFPDRNRLNKLTIQDKSDLLHLVAAIKECATGFITSEKAILRAAEAIRLKYGLAILSPEAFGQGFVTDQTGVSALAVTMGEALIETSSMSNEDHTLVGNFLADFHLPEATKRSATSFGTTTRPRRRMLVKNEGTVAAFASWDAPRFGTSERQLHMYVDERNPAAVSAVQHLLERACRDVGSFGPAVFRLSPLARQSSLRNGAINTGFRAYENGSPRNPKLQKACLGCVTLPEDWSSLSQTIKVHLGIGLPEDIPDFVASGQLLNVVGADGETAAISLDEFENILSPFILGLPNRPGVMLPIRASYAEDLFQGSLQPSMLDLREATLKRIRGYIGGAYNTIPERGLAVFYESMKGGGRGAAIAVARITRRYSLPKDRAKEFSKSQGVLDANVIGNMGNGQLVTITEFDSLMLFEKPVTLSWLRDIGCADGANFVTAKALSPAHLLDILRAGHPHV